MSLASPSPPLPPSTSWPLSAPSSAPTLSPTPIPSLVPPPPCPHWALRDPLDQFSEALRNVADARSGWPWLLSLPHAQAISSWPWACGHVLSHELVVRRTLRPSGPPFPRKQLQLAGRGEGPRACCPAQQGLLGGGWFQVPWPASPGWEAQKARVSRHRHHPLLPLVLGSDSLWP